MMDYDHQVVVLDDDHSHLTGLGRLLTTKGFRVRLHAEADGFFHAGMPAVPACLLLDNQLSDTMSGVQVHAEVQRRGWNLPTIFLTAHWNVQSVVNAIRAGADAFLTKPYDPDELLKAVGQALKRSQAFHQNGQVSAAEAKTRVASLTTREREIVRRVVAGKLNKEIADQLDLALVTVKVHRGRAMRKLGAGNPAELARIAFLANLCP